jgi:hypothetical protein
MSKFITIKDWCGNDMYLNVDQVWYFQPTTENQTNVFFDGDIVKTSTSIDEIGQKLKEIECLKGDNK